MSFTIMYTDCRDGVSSTTALNSGSSLYNPPKWQWLPSASLNTGTAGGSTNVYSSAVKVGYYNLQPTGQNDATYVEISLPAGFPSGTYYVYVYAEGYSADQVGFRVDAGTVTQVTVGTIGWKRCGSVSLTSSNKIRFSVGNGPGGGGINLWTVAVCTADVAPYATPTGQAGLTYSNAVSTNVTYPDSNYCQIFSVPDSATAAQISPLITAGGGPVDFRTDVHVTRLSSIGQAYTNAPLGGRITNLGTNGSVQPYYEFDNSNAKYSTMFVTTWLSDWNGSDGLSYIIFENPVTGDTYTFDARTVTGTVAGNSASFGNVFACGFPALVSWKTVRIKFQHTGSYIHAWVGLRSLPSSSRFTWEAPPPLPTPRSLSGVEILYHSSPASIAPEATKSVFSNPALVPSSRLGSLLPVKNGTKSSSLTYVGTVIFYKFPSVPVGRNGKSALPVKGTIVHVSTVGKNVFYNFPLSTRLLAGMLPSGSGTISKKPRKNPYGYLPRRS